MKKLLYTIPLLPLFLTSCDAHIGSRHYDVPWYDIAIPVAVFIIIVIAAQGKYLAGKTFVCPKCGCKFQPEFLKATFSIHLNDDRYFKCPACGKASWCSIHYKDK